MLRLFTGELFELVHVFTHGVLKAAVTRLALSARVTSLHAAYALDALRGRQRPAQGIAGPSAACVIGHCRLLPCITGIVIVYAIKRAI